MVRRGVVLALGVTLALSLAPAVAAERYLVCGHVPITGASPTPHHPNRFGQFYFDYVNAELGGIDGHPVTMQVGDDRYYPAGARDVVEGCKRIGAHLYVGWWGQDQIVSVARWAEANQVPYLHASSSQLGLEDASWGASLAPAESDMMRGLAHAMLADGAPRYAFGVVRIDSAFYEEGRDRFADALAERGHEIAIDLPVQKDERQFANVWFELQNARVTHVLLHVNALLAINMLNQKPTAYDPFFGAIEPTVSSSVVAENVPEGTRFAALRDPGPPYEPEDPDESELPWAAELAEFRRIFATYSPEQNPPPDSVDWDSYLRAKQLHRFLDALDEDLSPEHIRDQFDSYAEDPVAAFPTCALDFAPVPNVGGRSWHVVGLDQRSWRSLHVCADAAETDFAPPMVDCGTALLAVGWVRCTAADLGSGLASLRLMSSGTPTDATAAVHHYEGCPAEAAATFELPTGVHRFEARATDCTGVQRTVRLTLVAV